ncbi:MAG: hypothetical protein LQ338_004746 [Usnochroma carphineum]|nr:MAG: hypothetical protein LQ338_004746 [Usnochroma carphineum]
MTLPAQTAPSPVMFRPPINRAMKTLDRSFFKKDLDLAAACVVDRKKIASFQKELSKDILKLERLPPTRPVPSNVTADSSARCLLLKPEVQVDGRLGFNRKVGNCYVDRLSIPVGLRRRLAAPFGIPAHEAVDDIMTAILPDSEQDEIPVGFSVVGHVAHLNLRDQYLPYKSLIASVLMDKNPIIRTVINKIDDVGEDNEFRTFRYEVLAGPDDMNVEVREQDCVFKFDYSKVYWNTRLSTEHRRLVSKFNPGEAVCDVMAGVGPFALPTAKKRVWVWANDLNPESYNSLVENASKNKVTNFVRPFCSDGHSFIRTSTSRLLKSSTQITIHPKVSRSTRTTSSRTSSSHPPSEVLTEPKTFSHYILNLPATATTFLPSFIGLYAGHENLFHPFTDTKLPMIHVYCFSTKSDDNKAEEGKILKEISEQLGYRLEKAGDEEMEIWDVRDVAPQKRMFCASFRLPREVAFRKIDAVK